jgi:hypothetical protein
MNTNAQESERKMGGGEWHLVFSSSCSFRVNSWINLFFTAAIREVISDELLAGFF